MANLIQKQWAAASAIIVFARIAMSDDTADEREPPYLEYDLIAH
jgi:hypothetical protein